MGEPKEPYFSSRVSVLPPAEPTEGPPLPDTADTLSRGLWRSLALRDEMSAAHSLRVARWAVLLAQETGLSDDEQWVVRRGAMLHDVGKLGVPDAVLFKPGPLDAKERALVNEHCETGHALIRAFHVLPGVDDIVRFHHERWDGRGYPAGVGGDEIPLCARVVAVCDVYDAITADRPYRAGLGHDEAYSELQRCSGAQFDPMLVAAFLRVLDATRPG